MILKALCRGGVAVSAGAFVDAPWLRRLASLRLTLLILAGLGVSVAAAYLSFLPATWALVPPLAAFAVNLGAAVATHPSFRRDTSLLVFHLALIAIVLLIAAGRLTYLKGTLELADGETFSGQLSSRENGPWHRNRLEQAAFTSHGFRILYDRGVRRERTHNSVSWRAADATTQRAVIGDDRPLALAGYRFYTSFNKGFAPLFLWQPRQGAPVLGSVHLPAYPLHEYRQAQEWQPPGSTTTLWTMLQFDEVIFDPEKRSEFRLPEQHRLVVRLGTSRHELQPGESILLADGLLTYRGLGAWMGYTVFHDWTLPWLLAACLLAVASLAWYIWRKFKAQPWQS